MAKIPKRGKNIFRHVYHYIRMKMTKQISYLIRCNSRKVNEILHIASPVTCSAYFDDDSLSADCWWLPRHYLFPSLQNINSYFAIDWNNNGLGDVALRMGKVLLSSRSFREVVQSHANRSLRQIITLISKILWRTTHVIFLFRKMVLCRSKVKK